MNRAARQLGALEEVIEREVQIAERLAEKARPDHAGAARQRGGREVVDVEIDDVALGETDVGLIEGLRVVWSVARQLPGVAHSPEGQLRRTAVSPLERIVELDAKLLPVDDPVGERPAVRRIEDLEASFVDGADLAETVEELGDPQRLPVVGEVVTEDAVLIEAQRIDDVERAEQIRLAPDDLLAADARRQRGERPGEAQIEEQLARSLSLGETEIVAPVTAPPVDVAQVEDRIVAAAVAEAEGRLSQAERLLAARHEIVLALDRQLVALLHPIDPIEARMVERVLHAELHLQLGRT